MLSMTIVVQALRRGVDGRREPGRPGADDGDVEHLVVVEGLGQAERVGELRVATDSAARCPGAITTGSSGGARA